MSATSDRPTPRRDFLGKLATGAVVLTGTACAGTSATSAGATAPRPAGAATAVSSNALWDDSWFAKLTAAHKAVFDSPEIADFMAGAHVRGYLDAMKTIHNADANAVLVIRHSAIPLAFNDAMWAKYEIGKLAQVNDRGQPATRNPNASTIATFVSRGVILLGCDLATRNYSSRIATSVQGDRAKIYEELKANLVPTMILQPTGVYAAHRAQEAGCTYIRST